MSEFMRNTLSIFLFFTVYQLSYGQYTEATVHYQGGKQQSIQLLQPFFSFGDKLVTKDEENIWLKDIDKISVGDAEYLYKEIAENKSSYFILLRRIVDGTVSLYQLPEELEKHAYFIEKGGVIRKLQVLERKVDQNTIVRRKQYKSVLQAILYGCSALDQTQIDKVKLGYSSLKSLVVLYNEACGTLRHVESKPVPSKNRINIRLLTGYSFSNIPVRSRAYRVRYGNSEVSPKLSSKLSGNKPFLGIGVILKSEKFALSNDILFETFKAVNAANSSRIRTREQYYQTTWNIDYQLVYHFIDIRDQLAVTMHFLKRNQKNVFLGLGLSLNYLISNQSFLCADGTVDNDGDIRDYNYKNYIASDRIFRISPTITAGVELKRLAIHYQMNYIGEYIERKEKSFSEHRVQLSYSVFD